MSLAKCTIPRPVQLVIDDVGWREGWDLSAEGGPFRSGVERLLGPADYAAVADLGELLGVRPQCAMILCEWDQENLCARHPTTTHAGTDWDNSSRMGDWTAESADVFRTRSANIEFAMHGVGHEHWENGARTRAEWLGGSPAERWSRTILEGHLDCFRGLLAQHGLDPASGVSLPKSFVPCAFRFLWNNSDADSTGALMTAAGVRYASTPFRTCCFVDDTPMRPDGGLEHGILILDRGHSGIPWQVWDTIPERPTPNAICGTHWPNLLRPDPDENDLSIGRWHNYLAAVQEDSDTMLARNMADTCSQWLHSQYTRLEKTAEDEWAIDETAIPSRCMELALVQPVIVKSPLSTGALHARKGRVTARWRAGDWMHTAVRTEGGQAVLTTSDSTVQPHVHTAGTCDVLDVQERPDGLILALRVYGRQTIVMDAVSTPSNVLALGPKVTLEQTTYCPDTQTLSLLLSTTDIQGAQTEIRVQ
ncbi:MAG: hypothetical protein KAI66_00385 [Lentisphaeria bacterium]|nr:hypothetical protein [Lentisphaeria bacterium]